MYAFSCRGERGRAQKDPNPAVCAGIEGGSVHARHTPQRTGGVRSHNIEYQLHHEIEVGAEPRALHAKLRERSVHQRDDRAVPQPIAAHVDKRDERCVPSR